MHVFPNSGVIISEVKIRNFRSLREVNVKLNHASILIGENNSGKSSFIEALFAVLGKGTNKISSEDIFLAHGERTPPEDRHIIIDICIRPYDNTNKQITDAFSQDWVFMWGDVIQHDTNNTEFVGIRGDYYWNDTENEYQYERAALKEWKEYTDFSEVETLPYQLRSSHIAPISLYLLDAKRDIQDEFKLKSSFWNKLLSEIKIDDSLIEGIESSIQKINEEIVDKSEVLSHIQERLEMLDDMINLDQNSISINPLTRHIRDLYKGADVTFSTEEARSFSISNHGMGTRSLATILTFKAYCEWQEHKSQNPIHISIGLEEPEVHLHPQSQRALFNQIKNISAQKIISTHSPYIASETSIDDFIFFTKKGDQTILSKIETGTFQPEEMRRINQRIMKTKGELLFSRVLILFEGETESEAMPIYAEKYWGKKPECYGITMVHVGGNNYDPFIALAKNANISWYILSDGDEKTLNGLSTLLNEIGEDSDLKNHNNIVFYPNEKNYEEYIVWPKYRKAIESTIVSVRKQNEKHEEALVKEWENKTEKELISELSNNKTKYAKVVAEAIVELPEELCIPKKLRDLFDLITSECELRRCNEI